MDILCPPAFRPLRKDVWLFPGFAGQSSQWGERGGANLSPCVSLHVTGRHLLLRLSSSLDSTL